MELEGRVALVTGAAHGIGRTVASALAAAGARVAVADVDGPAAQAHAERLRGEGSEAIGLTADVGDLADIDRMVSAVVEHFGQVDCLVNNAGVTRSAYIMDLDEADWDRIHRVNAKGVFFCLQRVAREMIPARRGSIVNIASIAGRGFAGTSNAIYAASKGAVIALTRIAAHQLARHDINVNAVCPGVTRTELLDRIFEGRAADTGESLDDLLAKAARGIPLRRMNDPSDVASMVVFLASPAARNITGQSINVDGGIIMS